MAVQSLQEAFESRVAIVPFSTCHYWSGNTNGLGYGILRSSRASHVSYELHKGPIPDAIDGRPVVVRHKCDTPLCVNPDHLELGTQADNMRDAAERGRMPRGERHHNAKLTKEQAEAIVAAVEAGKSVSEVAARYGVSPGRVSMIRYGQSRWVKVTPPTGRSDRSVSDDTALAIYRDAHGGMRNAEVATRYGVSRSLVADIKRGATYARLTGHRR